MSSLFERLASLEAGPAINRDASMPGLSDLFSNLFDEDRSDAEPHDRRPHLDGVPVLHLPDPLPQVRRGTARAVSTFGEQGLHRPCRQVVDFGTPQLRLLVDDLFATLAAHQGMAIAANQIGVDAQVFVYDCLDEHGVRHVGHLINPVLEPLVLRGGRTCAPERCCSLPGSSADIARNARVLVRGRDLMGMPVLLRAGGALARLVQHEIDHLNGVLFADRLYSGERRRVLHEVADWR